MELSINARHNPSSVKNSSTPNFIEQILFSPPGDLQETTALPLIFLHMRIWIPLLAEA